jgi:hypothetical protein
MARRAFGRGTRKGRQSDKTAAVARQPVTLLLALGRHLASRSPERLPFLKKMKRRLAHRHEFREGCLFASRFGKRRIGNRSTPTSLERGYEFGTVVARAV